MEMRKETKKIEENGPRETDMFSKMAEDVVSVKYQSVGRASMCWEFPEKAGIFDSDRAAKIAYDLCENIANNMNVRTKYFGDIDA